MHIRFISSLTPEDEDRVADSLLAAARGVLEQFGLAYALRIETATGKVIEHHQAAEDTPARAFDRLATTDGRAQDRLAPPSPDRRKYR